MLLIDGDVICYKACPDRFRDIPLQLDADGKKVEVNFTMGENVKYMEQCWAKFKKLIIEMQERLFKDQVLIAVKGDGNFRDDVFSEYKANRKSRPANYLGEIVKELRLRAIRELGAIPSDGREADDLLRIWKVERDAQGLDSIICSIDKDLLTIPGEHYVIHKDESVTMTKAESCSFFYQQLIKGDPTDNIKGCIGIGDKKAFALIAPCKDEIEMRIVAEATYRDVYGDDGWLEMLVLCGQLVHLQRNFDDVFQHWGEVEENLIYD